MKNKRRSILKKSALAISGIAAVPTVSGNNSVKENKRINSGNQPEFPTEDNPVVKTENDPHAQIFDDSNLQIASNSSYGYEWGDASSGSSSDARWDGGLSDGVDYFRSLAQANFYGNAWAYAGRGKLYRPSTSGTRSVAVDHYREGRVVDGSASLSIVIFERDTDASYRYDAGSLVGSPSENETVHAQHHFEAGEAYGVGLEIETTASTVASVGSADFYTSSNRVEINDITIS